MLLGTLGASLLGNLLSGRGLFRSDMDYTEQEKELKKQH